MAAMGQKRTFHCASSMSAKCQERPFSDLLIVEELHENLDEIALAKPCNRPACLSAKAPTVRYVRGHQMLTAPIAFFLDRIGAAMAWKLL